MATHTQLPIYKVAYDLLDVATDLVKNMPRDFKQSIERPYTRSNNYMRATVHIAQNWHHVMGTFAAATFLHNAGVPLHVALRTLAGITA